MRLRGEKVERSFAHILDRGGMRRTYLRGRKNVHKRYLIHVAGFNLGLLMHALFGRGTPKEAADARNGLLVMLQADAAYAIIVATVIGGQPALCVAVVAAEGAI